MQLDSLNTQKHTKKKGEYLRIQDPERYEHIFAGETFASWFIYIYI